jgi:Zn-dependent protease with chaperone function
VIAHELSHIKIETLFLQTAIVVLVGIIALLSDIFLRSSF